MSGTLICECGYKDDCTGKCPKCGKQITYPKEERIDEIKPVKKPKKRSNL